MRVLGKREETILRGRLCENLIEEMRESHASEIVFIILLKFLSGILRFLLFGKSYSSLFIKLML